MVFATVSKQVGLTAVTTREAEVIIVWYIPFDCALSSWSLTGHYVFTREKQKKNNTYVKLELQ